MSFSDFKERLGKRESSGQYSITSPSGTMLGKYQFSPGRLSDLGLMARLREDYFWLPGMDREKFLANELNIQELAISYHFSKYVRRLHLGMHTYLITEKGFSIAGLLGVAHLLGYAGMVRWARASIGEREKLVDGLDTSGTEYYEMLKGFDISAFEKTVLKI